LVLVWLLHSTLATNLKLLCKVTGFLYLPVFVLLFAWYYVINIPSLVTFGSPEYGFYKFKYQCLESGLLFTNLVVFFAFVNLGSEARLKSTDMRDWLFYKATNPKVSAWY
jgi:hypothetical protein